MISENDKQKLQMEAKKLLDNQGFLVLLSVRGKQLTEDTMSAVEKDAVLEAHKEYNGLQSFYDWLDSVSKGQI